MKLERLGPYQLDRILGRGGMGAVYAGLNVETGKRAAVKVLNPALCDDQSFRERFASEVETLKKLLHPNIVQLFGFGEQDDVLFYAMELVEGRSLQDELLSGRRFQWREVARIGIDVARALKHAHDRGVIHRDLKPANLLIDSHDHVKLADFGIAKLYGGTSLTADGGVLGTADYMSPEQAEGKQVTARCDLYSLGSVLYALLTGQPPFSGKSLPEVLHRLRFEKPIPLQRLNPDVPEEFEGIVAQLLEKDPQKRIPTAVALANRLKAMEHALSLDTRIDQEPDDEEDRAAEPAGEPTTRPGLATSPLSLKTSVGKSLGPTMAMPADGDEPHLANADVSVVRQHATRPDPVPLTPAGSAPEKAASRERPVEAASRKTVFTTVTEEELRARPIRQADDDHPMTAWLKTGGLAAAVLLLVGAFYYYATRPPNADALYQRIKLAEEGGAEELAKIEDELTRFIAAFPDDPRTRDLKRLQEDVELHHLQRRFEVRARYGGTKALSPLEQEYLDAVRQSTSDRAGALVRLQALVDVFEGSQQLGKTPAQQRTAEQCLELARQQIERLSDSLAASAAAEKELLAARMKEADELAGSDPAAARRIWQGVVRLYGDKEWARALVEQAQAKLHAAATTN